jgi:hypothetical protein
MRVGNKAYYEIVENYLLKIVNKPIYILNKIQFIGYLLVIL